MRDVKALIAQERKCADLAAYFGGADGTRDDYDDAMEATDMALAGACATVSGSRQAEAPTKDYGTLLEWARETAGPKSRGINELADAVDDLLSRVPVVPVPVYEYGVKAPVSDKSYDIVPARSEQQARGMLEGARRSKLMRRAPASEWEFVPVGVDKP